MNTPNGGSKKTKLRNGLGLLALEPRLMYDGAAASTVTKQTATAAPIATSATVVTGETEKLQAADPTLDNGKHEIVFIDSNITDWQKIANDVQKGIEVVLFNGNGDGLKEIADYLATDNNVDAVHIVSHGTVGEVILGTDTINDSNLSSYNADLATISAALKPEGDILLYGCEVAEGQVGVQFISDLATLTGDVVAASSHPIGDAAEGGDWNLDVATGAVSVAAISAPDYDGLLSPLPNINENFTTESSVSSSTWTYKTGSWSGAVGSSVQGVELTQNATGQNGMLVYNSAFSAVDGIDLTFKYYMGPQTPESAADGLAFFLLDGGQSVPSTAGAFGGGLGYTNISAGLLGVGLDEYGNFSNGHSSTYEGNIVVRGSTSASNPLLTQVQPNSSGAPQSPGSGSASYIEGTHTEEVILTYNNANSHYNLTVKLDGITEISNYDLTAAGVNITSTLRFGFSAGTGGSSNEHSIESVKVVVPTSVTGLTTSSYSGSSSADIAKTATANDTPTLSGTGAANDTIAVYVDGTQVGTTTTDANGNWTYTLTTALSDGTHTLKATDTTASTTSANYSLTVDTPPTVSGADGTGVHTDTNGRPAITGTAAPHTPTGSTISVYSDGTLLGTTTTSDSAGDWSYTPSSAIADGSHTITATETVSGVTSGASTGYALSITTAPTVTGIDGTGIHTDTNSKPTITGAAATNTPTGSTISVYSDGVLLGTTTTASGGAWSFVPTTALAAGSHTITATETVGSVTSATSAGYALTLYAPPVVTGITAGSYMGPSVADGNKTATANALPTITGTAQANATVSVYDGTTLLGTTAANGSGAWSFTPTTALSAATHSITAKETISSYTSGSSAAFSLVIDTPAITLTAEPISGTYAVTYDISGSPILVDSIATLTENGTYTTNANYVGGSLEFKTSNGTGSDAFDITRSTTIATTAGSISVSSAGAVYLGTGGGATQIGTVSGAGTSDFKINLTSASVTDATMQVLTEMVGYSNSIGASGTTPGSATAVTITATDGYGVASTQTTNINFTNSHGSNTAPVLTVSGANPTVAKNGTAQIVDGSLTLTGSETLTSASVVVQNFQTGDVLGFTNSGGLTGSFNSSTGVLTITGTGTTSAYQTFMRNVTFSTSSTVTTARSISFVAGGGLYDFSNGHFYEFVSSAGITWQNADTAASQLTLYGMQGYLATVTSSDENAFIATRLSGQGWMGASNANIAPIASSSGTGSLTIGHWHWVTGPESLMVGTDGLPGDYFFQQTGGTNGGGWTWPSGTGGGSAVGGNYANWSSGEPNDANGTEHYAHFYTTALWNDYAYNNNSIAGYVVEFGGMPNDPSMTVAGTDTVNVVGSVTVSAPTLKSTSDSGISSSDRLTNDTALTFTGTSTANASVTLWNNTTQIGSGTADANGNWTITTSTLAQGTYAVTAKASEFGLNSSTSASTSVIVDTTAPTVAITTVTPATAGDATGVTSAVAPTIGGTISDNNSGTLSVEVYVDGVDRGSTTTSNGAWSMVLPTLSHGVHRVTVTGTDAAGNTSSLSSPTYVTVDTPPTMDGHVSSTVSTTVTEDGSKTLTMVGADADSDAVTWSVQTAASYGTVSVSSTGSVLYTPTAGQIHSDTFTIALSDGLGGTATETVNVTVNPINHAPVLTAASGITLGATTENASTASSSGTTFTVSSLLTSLTTQGGGITDIDTVGNPSAGDKTTGIAITTVDNTNGEWYYSTNNGSSWTAFTNTTGSVVNITSAAVLLDGAATGSSANLVKFVPNSNYLGTAQIAFHAWDESDSRTIGDTANLTSIGTGGSTHFSSAVAIASTTVTAVDAPPVIANPGPSVSYVDGDTLINYDGSGPVFVAPMLTLTNPGNVNTSHDNITQVKVAVQDSSVGVVATDVLAVSNSVTGGADITSSSYDSSTGILTINGSGTAAQWEASLRTVNYRDTATSDQGADTDSRQVTFRVTKGGASGTVSLNAAVTAQVAVYAINDVDALEGIPYTLIANNFDTRVLDVAGNMTGGEQGLTLVIQRVGTDDTSDIYSTADNGSDQRGAVTTSPSGATSFIATGGGIFVNNSGVASYTLSSGVLTINFFTSVTGDQVDAVLDQIQYTRSSGSGTYAIKATLYDDMGTTQSITASVTTTGWPTNIFNTLNWDNDPSGTLDTGGSTTLTIARFATNGSNTDPQAEDSWSATGPLSFADGTVTLNGLNLGSVSQSGGVLTITFNSGLGNYDRFVSDVLGLIQYTDTSATPLGTTADNNYTASVGFNIVISDGDNSVTAVTALTLQALNNAPTETMFVYSEVGEGDSVSVNGGGWTVADADAGSGNLVTVIHDEHGLINVNASGDAVITGNHTNTITITGTATDISDSLNSSIYISYSRDWAGIDTITMTTTDNGQSGVDGPKTTTISSNVQVDVINHSPVLTTAGTITLPAEYEQPSSNSITGTPVSALIEPGSITDLDTSFASDKTTGIAVTSVDNTNGEWYYSVNNGSTWVAFTDTTGSVVDIRGSAVLLDAALTGSSANLVKFVPNDNWNSTIGSSPTLIYRAWDESDGKSVGQTINMTVPNEGGPPVSYSTASATVSMDIIPVNDAPTLTLLTDSGQADDGGLTVTGNRGTHTYDGFAAGATGGGSDESSQTLTYTLTNDNNALFTVQPTISSDGQLSYTTAVGQTGSATVTVTLQDNGGTANGGHDTVTDTFTITVNAPPALATPVVTGITTGTDTGHSNSDGVTSNTEPVITGTIALSDVDDIVNVFVDGVNIGNATVDHSTGAWTMAVSSALDDGTHTVTALATNVYSDTSPLSNSYSLVIDTTSTSVPVITGITSQTDTGVKSDNITANQQPVVYGTAEANSYVDVFQSFNSGSLSLVGSTRADSSGNWSYTPSSNLAEGSYSFTVTSTDLAENPIATSTAYHLTIDITAPSVPTITGLSTETDTGVSHFDGITSNTSPTIIGRADVGSTVSVYADGTLLGTAVANSDGVWIFSDTAFIEGTHAITATAADAAANLSGLSDPYSLVIETNAPGAPVITGISTGTDSGALGDGLTKYTQPYVKGTSAADAIITLYDTDGTTVLGTTTANGSGAWTIHTSALIDGTHSLSATAEDAAGNIGPTSSKYALTIDTSTPATPAITGITAGTDTGTLGDNITSAVNPIVTGTATAGNTVTLYDTDGTTVLGTTVADTDGHWSITTSVLDSSVHSLTAKASNAAADVSAASSVYSLTIDTHTPDAPGIGIASSSDTGTLGDFITSNTTPHISGTGEAGGTITLYVDGSPVGTTTVANDGTWDYALPSALTDGQHAVSATDTDIAGTTGTSASFTLTIDTHTPRSPTVDLLPVDDTGVQNDDITNIANPRIGGTGEPGSTIHISINGVSSGTATVANNGTWSYGVPSHLPDGTYAVSATNTDIAGITGPSASFNLMIDTSVPSAPVISGITNGTDTGLNNADNITNNRSAVLVGTADLHTTVKIYDGTTLLGSTTVDSLGNWSYTFPSLVDGSHPLTATATNIAGTISLHSSSVAVGIDPTQNLAIPDQSWVGGNQQTYALPNGTFTGPTSDTLVYTATGLPFWATINSATGAITGTIPMAASGTANIVITATDNNGDHVSGTLNLAYVGPPPQMPNAAPTPPPQTPPAAPVNTAPAVPLVTVVSESATTTSTATPTGNGGGNGSYSGGSSWSGSGGSQQNSLPTVSTPPVPAVGAGLTAPAAGAFQTEVLKVTTSGSGDLTVVKPIADVPPTDNGMLNYSIGTTTFAHSDPTAVIHLSATMTDGTPLPSWIQFNARTGTLSGRPPADDPNAVIDILINATDNLGHTVTARVRFDLHDKPDQHNHQKHGEATPRDALHRMHAELANVLEIKPTHMSKPGLSAQIRAAHQDIHATRNAALLQMAARAIGKG